MTPQIAGITSSSKFFDIAVVLLSGLVTGPSFILISLLVWSYDNVRLQEICQKGENRRKSPSNFGPIPGDWGKLGMTNLARMSLMNSYWMLQKSQGYNLYRFWVIKGKPIGGLKYLHPD